MLSTSLRRPRKYRACEDRYAHLVQDISPGRCGAQLGQTVMGKASKLRAAAAKVEHAEDLKTLVTVEITVRKEASR